MSKLVVRRPNTTLQSSLLARSLTISEGRDVHLSSARTSTSLLAFCGLSDEAQP
jgi:hypothetical protein